MTLYHGSNADIDCIDLTRGLRYKDFGKGFYLTSSRDTAVRMAQKKARLFEGTPTLITYELDEAALTPEDVARLLQDRFLDQQYYFGTERALRFLHKTSIESV